MIKKEVIVLNEKGLHIEAAFKVTKIAGRFESKIQLRKDSQYADAKSIINLLMLYAREGDKLELIVEGLDEEAACEAIIDLFNQKFQEE